MSVTRRLPVPRSRGVYSKGIPWWMVAPPAWERVTPPASRLIVWAGYWRFARARVKEPLTELAVVIVPHATDPEEWFAVSREMNRIPSAVCAAEYGAPGVV